jgi:hypothetical protein
VADELEELTEDDAPLTAEDILRFGPVVEAQVWTVAFLEEERAPIARAAGRPRFGKVFNSEGMGKAVLIRPCVSRGKRIRGLPPIYTPQMLEANAKVFEGWPMYLDHVPAELAATAAKRGRSVKELGGQVVTPYFGKGFVQEYDGEFGYQPGAVLAEIWATPFLRNLVGENPNLLHTSIAAWPTSGKPAKAPWNPKVKGMNIEGLRRQPQGSVDFVPRGGAGGRLLLEGEQDPDLRAWPEPTWEDDDRRLVVSLAESFYASGEMTGSTANGAPDFTQMKPDELRQWVRENASHLLPALREDDGGQGAPAATGTAALTEADVRRIVGEAVQSAVAQAPKTDDVKSLAEGLIEERETQRSFANVARDLIREAEGIPESWKADLIARYSVLPSGPQPSLLVEAEEGAGENGEDLSEEDVLRRNVQADLDHARDLIAEATGKPRVTGEGGASSASTGDQRKGGGTQKVSEGEQTPYWRREFAEMGIVESEDKALAVHGVEKAEG